MPNEPEPSAIYQDDEEKKIRAGLAKEIGDAKGGHTPVADIIPAFDNPPNPAPASELPSDGHTGSAQVRTSNQQETWLEKFNDWYRGAVLGKSRGVPNTPLYREKKQRVQKMAGENFEVIEKD